MSARELIAEPLLTGAYLVGGMSSLLDHELSWSLPLSQALSHGRPLSGIAVFADQHETTAALRHARELEDAGAAVMLVAGQAHTHLPGHTMPILAVGREITFLEFNRLAAERILSKEAHVRRYAMTVHDRLAVLIHRGADLNGLVREIAAIAGRGALIFDIENRVIAHSMSGSREAKATVIHKLQAHFDAAEYLDRPKPLGSGLYVVRPDNTPVPLAPVSLIAKQILLGPAPEGWVVLLNEDTAPFVDHEVSQLGTMLEQASSIVATELLRQRSIVAAQERARGGFIQALVHGTFANTSELAARAEHHLFPLDATYTVLVAQSDHRGAPIEPVRLTQNLVRRLPHGGRHHQIFATVLGGIIVIVQAATDGAAAGAPPPWTTEDLAETCAQVLTEMSNMAIAVCYGSSSRDVQRIRESYREARVALEIAQTLGMHGAIAHHAVMTFSVLKPVAGTLAGREYVSQLLSPIRVHELARDLESTLLAYLESGGNLNEAARRLHVHRNTMISRVDKITALLGRDVRQPENQFALRLALHLDLLAKAQQKVADEIEPAAPYDLAADL